MLNEYLDVIFFFYGLAFFALGLVIFTNSRTGRDFALSRSAWLLASFGFLQGLLEWLDFWKILKGGGPEFLWPTVTLLLLSYLCLAEFGCRLLLQSLPSKGARCCSPWLYLPLLTLVFINSLWCNDPLVGMQIWTRYLVGFPGSVMTGIGLIRYYRTTVSPVLTLDGNRNGIRNSFYLAAGSFLVYGVLGGLIVTPAEWFPASVVNQQQFQALFHLPVQLFRAACAVLIAASATFILRSFHLEEMFRLKEAADEITRLARYNKMILQSVSEGIFGVDREGKTLFVNAAAERMVGFREDELLGRSIHELTHHTRPDGTPYPATECPNLSVLTSGVTTVGSNDLYWRKDGSSFPAEYTSAPIMLHDEIVGLVIAFRDITERKQNEALLRRNQEELEQLNSHLEERIGEEVARSRAKDLVVIRQEKLASLGQLAAGVAHEINNPVSFISGNLQMLAKYLEQFARYDQTVRHAASELSAPARDMIMAAGNELKVEYLLNDGVDLLNESLDGISMITRIVQDLKGFSRMDAEVSEAVDLNSCLERSLTIAHNELKYVATIRRELGDVPKVTGNRGQLNQVFLNLLVNAAHAIEHAGEITVRSWHDGQYGYVSISDTGKGIPEEIRERIFEPFYTTKEEGQGTGLGLSISFDIIKRHQGDLWVESEVGTGTTFTVKIPRFVQEQA